MTFSQDIFTTDALILTILSFNAKYITKSPKYSFMSEHVTGEIGPSWATAYVKSYPISMRKYIC